MHGPLHIARSCVYAPQFTTSRRSTMPIDLSKALGAPLPAIPYRWDENTLILYALGAGIGIDADQTSPAVLQYTYENGLKALPTFGGIPCFSALAGMMNLPGLTFNPMMLL